MIVLRVRLGGKPLADEVGGDTAPPDRTPREHGQAAEGHEGGSDPRTQAPRATEDVEVPPLGDPPSGAIEDHRVHHEVGDLRGEEHAEDQRREHGMHPPLTATPVTTAALPSASVPDH